MGRARIRPPRRRGLNRRDFLKRAGLSSAAIGALPLLPGCGDSGPAVGGPGRGDGLPVDSSTALAFAHGVASGDPLADRVMLWTRVTPAADGRFAVDYLVATDPALATVVRRGTTTTDATRDYTVKVDVDGLQPNTTYYYRFRGNGTDSPIGRTKTLPIGDVDRLRFGVVVCSSLAHGYFNAYARVAERADLDAVIHLGDYIYEYASDAASGDEVYGTVRPYEPTHEIKTLADYRQRHAQYKREPELQALHRQHPMIAIWDDHEFADNAWKGGAVNHQPDRDGNWDARVAGALQAYYEWMPTRPPDPSNLKKNYRSFKIGSMVELFMLEERVGFRDQQLDPNLAYQGTGVFTQTGSFADSSRQLLGSVEEQWLFDGLKASKANWKFIGQGVMMAQLKVVGAANATTASLYLNSDQWDGYDPARQRLFSAIQGTDAASRLGNVVVLTGDIHSSWAADLTPDPNNPVTALGGYNPLTGEGSLAVEYVCPSVTSPGLDQLASAANALKLNNPHFKYIDLSQHGYIVLDVRADRVSGEWWYVGDVTTRGTTNTFGTAYAVLRDANHLSSGTQSDPKPNPPPLAP